MRLEIAAETDHVPVNQRLVRVVVPQVKEVTVHCDTDRRICGLVAAKGDRGDDVRIAPANLHCHARKRGGCVRIRAVPRVSETRYVGGRNIVGVAQQIVFEAVLHGRAGAGNYDRVCLIARGELRRGASERVACCRHAAHRRLAVDDRNHAYRGAAAGARV